MDSTRSTHGLCTACLSNGALNLLSQKKPNHCCQCLKDAEILFNQDPFCTSCYIQTITSPTKSEASSHKGHQKTKSFYRPIDKEEVRSMKKSFLSSNGKLIKKISRIFQENLSDNQAISFLNKKGYSLAGADWQKLIQKVNKNSNIIYLFFGKSKVIGAFHTQGINIEGQASVWDQEAGIFSMNKYKEEPQFARVKSDMVSYSVKSKTIKFGSPSSFQITFQKGLLKITSQLAQQFESLYSYMYRP